MGRSPSIYENINLSEFSVVKLLIQFRDKYDDYYLIKQNNHYDVAGDVMRLNTSMIHTFAYLDELIDKCKFDSEQKTIIQMIQVGYTYREIAEMIGKGNADSIRRRFNKICRDIVNMNNRLWRKYIYTDKLGLKTKTCNKCQEELPATDEFFSPDNRIIDGFHSFCKICR